VLLAQTLLVLKEDDKAEEVLRRLHAWLGEEREKAEGQASGHGSISARDRAALGAAALYRGFGKPQQGLEWAERLSPGERRERTRADLLCHLRRFDEAVRAGIEAVKAEPADPENYVYLEWACGSAPAEATEAARICIEIVERNPRNAGALTVLAVLADRRGAHGEAIQLFERARASDPRNINTRLWHAVSLHGAGDPQKALEVLEEARSLPARTLNERRGVAGNLGNVHESLGNLDTCLGLYQEALRLDPGQAWGHARVGRILVRLGRVAEAIPYLDRAQEFGAWDPYTLEELRRARKAMGDQDGEAR
jgi:tetratricopeptide (TPR) repeat protein